MFHALDLRGLDDFKQRNLCHVRMRVQYEPQCYREQQRPTSELRICTGQSGAFLLTTVYLLHSP